MTIKHKSFTLVGQFGRRTKMLYFLETVSVVDSDDLGYCTLSSTELPGDLSRLFSHEVPEEEKMWWMHTISEVCRAQSAQGPEGTSRKPVALYRFVPPSPRLVPMANPRKVEMNNGEIYFTAQLELVGRFDREGNPTSKRAIEEVSLPYYEVR